MSVRLRLIIFLALNAIVVEIRTLLMDFSKLTSSTLRSISGLTDTLSATLAELKKIETSILSSVSGSAPAAPAKRGRKPGSKAVTVKAAAPAKKGKAPKATKAPKAAKAVKAPAASGKRGAVKEQIVAALKKAGAKGISVKELSTKLDIKPGNIHVWFATTGKTVGVEKVAPGVYRLA